MVPRYQTAGDLEGVARHVWATNVGALAHSAVPFALMEAESDTFRDAIRARPVVAVRQPYARIVRRGAAPGSAEVVARRRLRLADRTCDQASRGPAGYHGVAGATSCSIVFSTLAVPDSDSLTEWMSSTATSPQN